MFIDGVKIEVLASNGTKWEQLPCLEFKSSVNEATGEIIGTNKVAYYKGLRFIISTSTKNQEIKTYSVRGSLPKYWNNGTHNATDFDYSEFIKVIQDLQTRFFIDPITSIIHNIEFGVNVHTPITAKKVLDSLVSLKNDTFYNLKINNVSVGKKQQKQRHTLKLYDKGKQAKIQDNNLLRIEIAVKKMHYLKDFNINTLSDLLDVNNIKPLGQLLVNEWTGIIYYDYGMQWRKLPPFEKQKFLYYIRPAHWLEFSKKQRYRAKTHFNELLSNYCTSTTQEQITNNIVTKWELLTAVMCPPLNRFFEKSTANHLSTFEPFKCTVQSWTFKPLNTEYHYPLKTTLKKKQIKSIKKRKCHNCKKDITHKYKNALYCSKKCNNTLNGIRRTTKRKKGTATELHNLQKLLNILKSNKLTLAISYKNKNAIDTDNLHQKDINAPPQVVRKITKLVAFNYRKNTKPITLTTLRAKQLINQIIKQNQKITR